MAEVTPGTRYRSAVCATELVVVKGSGEMDLRIGGAPVLSPDQEPSGNAELDASAAEGSQIGKRYVDADDTIEVLCSKGGEGSPGLGDTLLTLKDAKPLPSSD